MRIMLKISYDGTDFCGYQIQPNKRTVEGVLGDAIFKLTGEKVKLVGSGRTDSGVHALAQVVHFDTLTTIPSNKISYALNGLLPSDVKVLSSKKVNSNFNARYSAKKKTYRYSCYVSDCENPLLSRYKTLISEMPNVEIMKKCADVLVGTHDFKCFLASGSSVKNTVRTIYSIKIVKKSNLIDFEVCGNGFLYNMVRILVGTLIKVGCDLLSISEVEKSLITGNRKNLGKTMQAKGLTLVSVNYK